MEGIQSTMKSNAEVKIRWMKLELIETNIVFVNQSVKQSPLWIGQLFEKLFRLKINLFYFNLLTGHWRLITNKYPWANSVLEAINWRL